MKKLLSNLSTLKAERTKYHFTVVVQDLQQFELGLKDVKGIDQDTTFCILWKRGSKRNGKTENILLKDGKLVWNSSFNIDITLFKEQKKGFLPKTLELSLETTDKKNRKQILGKAEVNLSQFASEEEKKSPQTPVILTISKKPSKINLSITSAPKKKEEGDESDSLSLMTDNEDDLESESSNGTSMRKTSQTSIEHLNKIQELQNRIRELEALVDPKSDKVIIIENLTKERDDLKKKVKTLEGSVDGTKTELDRTQVSNKLTEEKLFDAQLQLKKALHELEELNKNGGTSSTPNIKVVDLENELISATGQLKGSQEKVAELESKLKELQSNPSEKRVNELKILLDEKTKQLNYLKKNDVLEDLNKMKKKYDDLKKSFDELSQNQVSESEKSKLEELTQENEELKSKLNEETSNLKSEISNLEENIKKLQSEKSNILANTTKTIEKFKEQEKNIYLDFENEKKQLKEEIETLKKKQNTISSPEVKMTGVFDQSQLNELKSQNTKLDQKIKSLTQELDQSKTSLKEESNSKAQLEKEKKDLENKVEELKKTLMQPSKNSTPTENERLKTLEKLNKDLVNDIKKVGEEKKKLEDESKKLKEESSQKDKKLKELESKTSTGGLEKVLKEKDVLIQKEQDKSKGLENQLSELDKKNKEIESKLKETVKKLSEKNSAPVDNKIEEMEKKLLESDKKFKELDSKFKETESKLKEAEKKLSEKSSTPVVDNKKELQEYEKKLSDSDKKLKETESKLKETEKKLSEKSSVVVPTPVVIDNKKEVEEIERKHKEEQDKSLKKMKEIEVKLSTEELRSKDLEKKLKESESKSNEIEAYKQKISTLESNIEASKKSENTKQNQELDQLKKDMKILSLEITEKYIIDNSIVFLVPEYDNGLPIYLKVLYLSLNKFKVFDPKQNLTFCENMIKAIDFSIDKDSIDNEKLIFWIHLLSRYYDLLKSDYPEQFKKVSFKELQKLFKKNHKRLAPTYLSCLKGDIKRDTTENNIVKFIQDIFQMIIKSYFLLHTNLNERLTKFMNVSIFEAKKEKVLSTIKSGDLNGAIEILNEFYNLFKKQNIEVKIINHFLESEILYLDTIIFNNLMKENNFTSLGIEIKMFLSILESWFDNKGIQMKFTHARQSADVCVIAEKSVLTDKTMRSAICPNLTIQQIGRLLSINTDDFGSKHKDLPKEIQDAIKQGSGNISTLMIQYQIEFEKFFNSITYPNQKDLVQKIKLPERFTSLSMLDYLK